MATANPLLGEVALPPVNVAGFEAGGVLLLDFNALCALEGVLAKKIDEIGTAVLESPSMMRTVMRVALEQHHPTVDELEAGRIIQAIGLDVAAELILKAFTLSFPEAAPGGDKGPRTAAATPAGTGGAASKSGSKSDKPRKRSGTKPRASSRK